MHQSCFSLETIFLDFFLNFTEEYKGMGEISFKTISSILAGKHLLIKELAE